MVLWVRNAIVPCHQQKRKPLAATDMSLLGVPTRGAARQLGGGIARAGCSFAEGGPADEVEVGQWAQLYSGLDAALTPDGRLLLGSAADAAATADRSRGLILMASYRQQQAEYAARGIQPSSLIPRLWLSDGPSRYRCN